MSIERGPSPQETETKQETAQESTIDALELEPPAEDPWFQHQRVDQYNSQQMWEDLYADTLEKWKTNVLEAPDVQQKLEGLEDEVRQEIEANIEIVLKNELLRHQDNILGDKELDYKEIEGLMLDEVGPLGKEGLASEMHITQKLVEAGVETRLDDKFPQGGMLDEKQLIEYIENASPGFFDEKNKEEKMRDLKRYASTYLKGYAAVSYARFRDDPLVEGPMIGKTIDTMTDLSFDLHKYYEKPTQESPWPSKKDWRLRNMKIQDKLDSVFGVWTNPAGHSYEFEQ